MKLRMMNVSSPESPLSCSTALLRKTSKKSSPVPPLMVVANETPLESSPRVEAKKSAGVMPKAGQRRSS